MSKPIYHHTVLMLQDDHSISVYDDGPSTGGIYPITIAIRGPMIGDYPGSVVAAVHVPVSIAEALCNELALVLSKRSLEAEAKKKGVEPDEILKADQDAVDFVRPMGVR